MRQSQLGIIITLLAVLGHPERYGVAKPERPSHNQDTIWCCSRMLLVVLLRFPDLGSFSGSLTSPKRGTIKLAVCIGRLGAVGGWSELIRNSINAISRTW